jgi:hypothetical protein
MSYKKRNVDVARQLKNLNLIEWGWSGLNKIWIIRPTDTQRRKAEQRMKAINGPNICGIGWKGDEE